MQVRSTPSLNLRRALCCALVAVSLAFSPGIARAESVLLILPRRADPALLDVFHRLEAELKIHGYDTESASSEVEAKPAASARAAGALAAIAIVKRGSAVALQVWLIDRAGGSAGPRRIEAGGARDASSLLAVRAVDLLRATFGEPSSAAATPVASAAPSTRDDAAAHGGGAINPRPGNSTTTPATAPPNAPKPAATPATTPAPAPTPNATKPAATPAPAPAPNPTSPATTSAPASPNQSSPAAAPPKPQPSAASSPDREAFVPEPANEPERPRALLWLSAEGALIYPGASFGTGFGPALGLDVWLLSWLSVGVHGVAPLLGNELSRSSGSATITQELAWLELRARVFALGPVEIYPLLGGGIDWLQGQGHAKQPLTSSHDHNWSWMAQLGLRVEVALLPRLHIGAALRLAAFAPPLEVAVARDSKRLGPLTLNATLGLALGFF